MRLILIFLGVIAIVLGAVFYVGNAFNPDSSVSVASRLSKNNPQPVELEDVDNKQESEKVDSLELEKTKNELFEEYKLAADEKIKYVEELNLANEQQLLAAEEEKKRLEEELAKKNEIKMVSVPFVKRPVPPLSLLSSSDSINVDTFNIVVDKASNSWLIRGNQEFIDYMIQLIRTIDLEPLALDLDVLYVAVNEDRIRSLGLTALFREGASYLHAVDLGFDTFGMNLSLGEASISLDAQRGNEEVNVVTLPIQRVITGRPFKFSNADQIPIQQQTISDGLAAISYVYRPVGLSFSGQLDRFSGRYHLDITQTLGSVVGETQSTTDYVPPVLREVKSTTSSFLELNKWSCLSGMLVERKIWKRGILSKRRRDTRDLVLMFVRPRDTLKVIPRAIPEDSMARDGSSHPLLPAKP